MDKLKVVTQPVKIIRTLYPFRPKKMKGKTQKRVWSDDTKNGEQVWGKLEGA